MKIKASSALFIKLGPKGSWEKKCIEEENTIRLGFHNPHHEDCLRSNWEKVEEYWSKHKKTKGKITETVSQIKYFYESPEDTIWITFYNRKLYWCFAEKKVNILEDESRVRKVIGKWSSEDIAGNPLNIENLSG
ncbi:MAG: hypothetical protein KDC90_09310, partial [Ignavibacteriae bacterium]|nr:hypothetical protein [Ignavibacteriota bacterium]